MNPRAIRFSLHDASAGYEVSPERVPLAVLGRFVKDVGDFLRGDASEPLDPFALDVAVLSGSLAIEAQPPVLPLLVNDVLHLHATQHMEGVSARRRAVVARWQHQAWRSRLFRVEIMAGWLPGPVVIHADSHFQSADAEAWVQVERYVRGQIEELGGHKNINAHVRLPDGSSLTVNASKELLAREPRNRLYKPALLRIRAEFNLRSQQYRDATLLEFVEHDVRVDGRVLARLAQRGEVAWREMPEGTAWVEQRRGRAAP